MPLQAICKLVGGALVLGGAGILAFFLYKYVRFGESTVPWQDHQLYPLAADGMKLWLGKLGAGALLAGLALIAIPNIFGAFK